MSPRPSIVHRASIAIFVGAFLFFLAGCAAGPSVTGADRHSPDETGALRVGVTPNAPPLIFKQNGNIVGLEADLARGLAAFMGKPLQLVELKWDRQIPALLKNKTDIIMSGMTITRMRMVQIAFSRPYFKSGQMALIHIDSVNRFQLGIMSIEKSKSIGVVRETTGQYFVEKTFPKVRQVVFANPTDAAGNLLEKRIEVFIHDAPVILNLAARYRSEGLVPVDAMLTQEYLGWGMRKEDAALIDTADRYLQKLLDENRLYPLVKRWIPLARVGN
jgi:polar amino acid transport system substrate-binding protein